MEDITREHETHQDIESADFARLNPAAALLCGLDGRTYRDRNNCNHRNSVMTVCGNGAYCGDCGETLA